MDFVTTEVGLKTALCTLCAQKTMHLKVVEEQSLVEMHALQLSVYGPDVGSAHPVRPSLLCQSHLSFL